MDKLERGWVRQICRDQELGQFDFLDNGSIILYCNAPNIDKIIHAFPKCQIIDSGPLPLESLYKFYIEFIPEMEVELAEVIEIGHD